MVHVLAYLVVPIGVLPLVRIAVPMPVQVFLLDGESITRLALQLLFPKWRNSSRARATRLILNAGTAVLLTGLLSLITGAVLGQ